MFYFRKQVALVEHNSRSIRFNLLACLLLVEDWVSNLGIDTAHVTATGQTKVTSLTPTITPAVLDNPGVRGVAHQGDGMVDGGAAIGITEHTAAVVAAAQSASIQGDVEWAEEDQSLLDVLVAQVLGYQTTTVVVFRTNAEVADSSAGTLRSWATVVAGTVGPCSLDCLPILLNVAHGSICIAALATVRLGTIDKLLLRQIEISVGSFFLDQVSTFQSCRRGETNKTK